MRAILITIFSSSNKNKADESKNSTADDIQWSYTGLL